MASHIVGECHNNNRGPICKGCDEFKPTHRQQFCIHWKPWHMNCRCVGPNIVSDDDVDVMTTAIGQIDDELNRLKEQESSDV